MIDVVGADSRAHEFLHEEVFLIGGPGAGKTGNGIRAVHGLEVKKAFGNGFKRLFPGSFYQLAILANQRVGKPVLVMNKMKAEASLDAEGAMHQSATKRLR